MRYPAEATAAKHERILNEAARAYREKGFDGVSVQEIMKATGLTHGPFYNHFRSKDALIAETLKHISKEALGLTDGFPRDAAGKADFIRSYLSSDHRDAAGSGCLMAALGAEISREPSYRPAFTRHLGSVLHLMMDRFPWSRTEKKRRQAITTLAAMVGAIVLSRAVDDADLSDEILSEVASELAKG
jgi:TetR/AcrR family transcriptional repressor of nem operon